LSFLRKGGRKMPVVTGRADKLVVRRKSGKDLVLRLETHRGVSVYVAELPELGTIARRDTGAPAENKPKSQ
jgi:hypothetical protein